MVATREYDGGGNRTISGAFRHVANSLGFNANQIDTSAINALETAWWTPRENILTMRQAATVLLRKIFSTKSPKQA